MSASRVFIAAFVALVATLVTAATASAKTYEVNKRSDHAPNGCKKKDCTLREAVLAANNHGGADKIVLPERKTYNLSIQNEDQEAGEDEGLTGDLDVTDDVRVTHPGKGSAKVDANGIDRAFQLLEDASVTIKKLTIRGGAAPEGDSENGGAILLDGDDVGSSLILVRSKLVGNRAAQYGGAIADYSDGRLTVLGSKVANNTAESDSGAIDISKDGSVLIKNTTISGNRSLESVGGASYVNANEGVSIVGSTISGNSADGVGGALDVTGDTLQITNSTIAGNHSEESGGGIFNGSGEVSLNAVTVARNSADGAGGGLFNNVSIPFEVENSLIALNQAGDVGEDCANGPGAGAEFDSLGHNLLSELDTDSCEGFDVTGDFVNSNPKLGKLKNNGGPTQTVALKKGSPAVNKAAKSAPNKDQRGEKRGKKPDIGAYERVKKKKKKGRR
jgi:CSLREA domain-containing protein